MDSKLAVFPRSDLGMPTFRNICWRSYVFSCNVCKLDYKKVNFFFIKKFANNFRVRWISFWGTNPRGTPKSEILSPPLVASVFTENALKVGLGISRTNAGSQWNPVYNVFH